MLYQKNEVKSLFADIFYASKMSVKKRVGVKQFQLFNQKYFRILE